MESFRLLTPKKFRPQRLVYGLLSHMGENVRRLEPGSIPTVWRKSEKYVDQPLMSQSSNHVKLRPGWLPALNSRRME